ncbi:MAG: hypothetical protein H6Q59_2964 [Firmicutes bacterium]|nr:hypothetical protein [Bacillota bacterium]
MVEYKPSYRSMGGYYAEEKNGRYYGPGTGSTDSRE